MVVLTLGGELLLVLLSCPLETQERSSLLIFTFYRLFKSLQLSAFWYRIVPVLQHQATGFAVSREAGRTDDSELLLISWSRTFSRTVFLKSIKVLCNKVSNSTSSISLDWVSLHSRLLFVFFSLHQPNHSDLHQSSNKNENKLRIRREEDPRW